MLFSSLCCLLSLFISCLLSLFMTCTLHFSRHFKPVWYVLNSLFPTAIHRFLFLTSMTFYYSYDCNLLLGIFAIISIKVNFVLLTWFSFIFLANQTLLRVLLKHCQSVSSFKFFVSFLVIYFLKSSASKYL